VQVVPLLPRCDGTIRWRWGFCGGVSGVAVGDARTATAKVRVVMHHTFSPEGRMRTHIPLVNSATLSTWNDSRSSCCSNCWGCQNKLVGRILKLTQC